MISGPRTPQGCPDEAGTHDFSVKAKISNHPDNLKSDTFRLGVESKMIRFELLPKIVRSGLKSRTNMYGPAPRPPVWDYLVQVGTPDCLVKAENPDLLVKVETPDYLVKAETPNCMVKAKTPDCLVEVGIRG